MKRTIQIALAALLLAGLAAGCDRPTIPPCISEDGAHKWGKWETKKVIVSLGVESKVAQRTCETCGWTERSMGE